MGDFDEGTEYHLGDEEIPYENEENAAVQQLPKKP